MTCEMLGHYLTLNDEFQRRGYAGGVRMGVDVAL